MIQKMQQCVNSNQLDVIKDKLIYGFIYFTSGEISLNANPNLDFETVPQYILTVTVSDPNGLDTTQDVTIDVTDVNESPVITSTIHQADIPESEVTSQVVVDVDASDPENDILDYQITSTSPTGAPFTIDSSSGKINLYNNI